MVTITADDLERWSDTFAAKPLLPELVSRLARADAPSATEIDFPADMNVVRSGWDGLTTCETGGTFVPAGRTGWEMGAGKNPPPKGKAKEDYESRLKDVLPADRAGLTFVFVTSRNWAGARDWAAEKRAAGDSWAGVEAYDACRLAQELAVRPAVALWLAGKMNVPTGGATALHWFLEELHALTDPPLPNAAWLAGRAEAVERITAFADGEPRVLRVDDRGTGDGLRFAAAALGETEAADRAVVVKDQVAWDHLRVADAPAILLVDPSFQPAVESLGQARGRHHVVTFGPRPKSWRGEGVTLPRAYPPRIETALRDAGFDGGVAERAAARCGGSVAVLAYLLTDVPDVRRPVWVDDCAAPAALWCGGWAIDMPGDAAALRDQGGGNPPDLSPLTAAPADPAALGGPLLIADPAKPGTPPHGYRVTAPVLGWLHLGDRTTGVQFETFSTHARAAFGLDPARSAGDYSPRFRRRAARTLALLAGLPTEGDHFAIPFAAAVRPAVDHLVTDLLPPGDGGRWVAAGDLLRTLADAAPDAFLRAVEADLAAGAAGLTAFIGQDRGWRYDLVWSLEARAWEPPLFRRTCWALTKLGPVWDVNGGNAGNSPTTSLARILCDWLPQTRAGLNPRTAFVQELADDGGSAAWAVLAALLPHHHTVMPTNRPTFGGPAATDGDRTVSPDRRAFQTAAVYAAAHAARSDPGRWKTILENLDDVPGECLPALRDGLAAIAPGLSDVDRRTLADELRTQLARLDHHVARHPPPEGTGDPLAPLRNLLPALEPRSPALRLAYRFGQTPPRHTDESWEEAGVRAERERREALNEVLAAPEPGAELDALIAAAPDPGQVGFTLADREDAAAHDGRLSAWFAADAEPPRLCAAAFVRRRVADEGQAWVDGLGLQDWPPTARVGPLLAFGVIPEAWDRADRLGVGEDYWAAVVPYAGGLCEADLRTAADRLLAAGRPWHAAHLLNTCHEDAPPPAPKRVSPADLTIDVLRACGAAGLLPNWDYHYNAGDLLKAARPELSPDVQRELEWLLLPALEGGPEQPTLLRRMLVTDPEFFVRVLAARAGELLPDWLNAPADGVAATDEGVKNRAGRLLWELDGPNDCPGFISDAPDADALRTWYDGVMNGADAADLRRTAECETGHVLARCPAGADGIWPAEIVRDLLELDSVSGLTRRAFAAARCNKRYPSLHDPADGGRTFRSNADELRAAADRLEPNWPLTAETLRLAATYHESTGGHFDERRNAELEREF